MEEERKRKTFFEKIFLGPTERIAQIPTFVAIRSAFFVVLPFIFMSSLANLYANFPLDMYADFMASVLGSDWRDLAIPFTTVPRMLIAPMLAFLVAYQFGLQLRAKDATSQISPIIMGLCSLVVFYNMIPGSSYEATEYWVAPSGLAIAILTSIVSTKFFLFLFSYKGLRLQWPGTFSGLAVIQSFSSFVPAMLTILFFTLADEIFIQCVDENIYTLINALIVLPLKVQVSGLWQSLSYTFLHQILWFFGFHGGYMLQEITTNIYDVATYSNLNASFMHYEPPHIFTSTFMRTFVFTGGAGSIALVGTLLFFGETLSSKKLALFCLIPCMFSMDELLLFGFPIVLNPILLIPFTLVPLISVLTSYLATYFEFIPRIANLVDWTTPVFFNAYLATKSLPAVLLQILNVVLGILIYRPFVYLDTTIKLNQRQAVLKKLLQRSVCTVSNSQAFIQYNDDAGALARSLVVEMEKDLNKGTGFFLMFQPQICAKGKRVLGVESLVRWKNSVYGEIPTPIVIALAEDSGLIKPLGLWVFEEACRIRKKWMELGIKDMVMSVNVSGLQLDEDFPVTLREIMNKYDLPFGSIEIEVTESRMLTTAKNESKILLNLYTSGFPLAIDDFGMGHSSLKYLRQFPVSMIKIDGAIIRDILTNPICADIVRAIVRLCRARNMRSTAEFVETEKHAEALRELGCDVFQGYLYSKPLLPKECYQYIVETEKKRGFVVT